MFHESLAVREASQGRPCTWETCTIEQSYYGYRPNLGIDIFFVATYSAIIFYCIYVCVTRRRWLGYTIAIILGSVLELVGFAARIYGYYDPFHRIGWIMQYSLLTFAPVLLTAAIYVSLGRLAGYLGRGKFGIRPRLYARIFIPSDILALVIQSSGGALSITSMPPTNGGTSTGQLIVIGGLAFQVVSLAVFFILFLAVVFPAHVFSREFSSKRNARIRLFIVSVVVAILLVLGRSAYRVVEFSQGIHSDLAQNEILFIILDGFPIGIATTLLVAFHPVRYIPAKSGRSSIESADAVILPEQYRREYGGSAYAMASQTERYEGHM